MQRVDCALSQNLHVAPGNLRCQAGQAQAQPRRQAQSQALAASPGPKLVSRFGPRPRLRAHAQGPSTSASPSCRLRPQALAPGPCLGPDPRLLLQARAQADAQAACPGRKRRPQAQDQALSLSARFWPRLQAQTQSGGPGPNLGSSPTKAVDRGVQANWRSESFSCPERIRGANAFVNFANTFG